MPVRKIPKNYRSVTGMVANIGFDKMTAYESTLERDCIKLVIFNTNIAEHEEQPVKILYYDSNGKQHSYTPDILIKYRTDINPAKEWKPLLAEVKFRDELFKNWSELKPKIRAGRHYAKERGWDFTVLTECEIRTSFLGNVTFLLEYRKIPVNESYSNILLETLRSLGETNPETLALEISEDPFTRAQLLPSLWQLVANQMIGIDLMKRLTMHSSIWPILPMGKDQYGESIIQFKAGCGRRNRWRALRHHSYYEY